MSWRTLLVLLAYLAFVSLGLPDGLLGVSWPSIRGDFTRPLDALGLVVTVQTAGYLISSFATGALLRRMGVGTLLALSTAAAAMALLGVAATSLWLVALACFFLAGLGGGAVDAALNAYGASHFSVRTLNWLHAFFGLGTTLGPLIATAVLGAGQDWRWSYAIVGACQLALAALFVATRAQWARAPETQAGSAAPQPRGAPIGQTLRLGRVWLGMLVFFVYAGVEVATAQWSYSLLTLGRGVPPATAGLIVGLYWGGLMAGRMVFGLVADRVPLGKTLRLCLTASLLGALLFWRDPTPVLAVAGLMLVGLGLAPVFASLIGQTPGRVGEVHAHAAIGFQIAAAGLGGACLTAVAGQLASAYGLEAIGLAIAGFTLLLLALHEALIRWSARS